MCVRVRVCVCVCVCVCVKLSNILGYICRVVHIILQNKNTNHSLYFYHCHTLDKLLLIIRALQLIFADSIKVQYNIKITKYNLCNNARPHFKLNGNSAMVHC